MSGPCVIAKIAGTQWDTDTKCKTDLCLYVGKEHKATLSFNMFIEYGLAESGNVSLKLLDSMNVDKEIVTPGGNWADIAMAILERNGLANIRAFYVGDMLWGAIG